MNDCPIHVTPMEDWIQTNDGSDFCKPCILAPIVSWYREELEEIGKHDLSEQLLNMSETLNKGEEHVLCNKLDEIKGAVDSRTRERLLEFDCSIQTFAQDQSQ